jgi:hypothetical protein
MNVGDDFLRSFLMGALGGPGMIDWVTVVALFLIGTIYCAAPALGYSRHYRSLLTGSMWVLLAKMSVSVLKTSMLFFEHLNGKSTGLLMQDPDIFVLFQLFESGLFILAMALFIAGLMTLRRAEEAPRAAPESEPRRYRED